VKLFQKDSNAYDHSPPTLQTDRRTTYGNTALRYASRGNNNGALIGMKNAQEL